MGELIASQEELEKYARQGLVLCRDAFFVSIRSRFLFIDDLF